jgi:hypothetical protein
MTANPIVPGLLYRVRGYGLDVIVSATNGAHAILIATEKLPCAD